MFRRGRASLGAFIDMLITTVHLDLRVLVWILFNLAAQIGQAVPDAIAQPSRFSDVLQLYRP